jgi:hypothetical protein
MSGSATLIKYTWKMFGAGAKIFGKLKLELHKNRQAPLHFHAKSYRYKPIVSP